MKNLKIRLTWAKATLISLILLSGLVTIHAIDSDKSVQSKKTLWEAQHKLITTTGEDFKIKPVKGKFILINFWATWCAPCRRELPELNLFNGKRNKNQVQVLAVCVDNAPKKIKAFLKNMDVHFEVLIDNKERLSDFYKISQMPTTILLNSEGLPVFRSEGYSPETIKKIKQIIEDKDES